MEDVSEWNITPTEDVPLVEHNEESESDSERNTGPTEDIPVVEVNEKNETEWVIVDIISLQYMTCFR